MSAYPVNSNSGYNPQGQYNMYTGGASMSNNQRHGTQASVQTSHTQQTRQPGNPGQIMNGRDPRIVDIKVALPGRDSAQVTLPQRPKQPPRDPNLKTDLNFISEAPEGKIGERVLFEPEPPKPQTKHLKDGETMPQPTVTRRLVAVSEMVKEGKRMPAERKSPPVETISEKSPEKKYSGAPVAELAREDSGFKIGEGLKLGAGTKGVKLSPELSPKKDKKKTQQSTIGHTKNTNSADQLYGKSINPLPVEGISHNIYEHSGRPDI